MKAIRIIFMLTCLFMSTITHAQQINQATFHGATSDRKHFDALYIVNSADDKKIRSTLSNINNALNDPRLKGKLQVELVAFGDGVQMYMKSAPYEKLLTDLQKRGVVLSQCENTMKERDLNPNQLWPFIAYVPSGNGEIIIRQYQGWAVVHP